MRKGPPAGCGRRCWPRCSASAGRAQEGRSAFQQAYKQATFGREEKGLGEQLEELIRQKRGYYQVLPDADAWGREDRIWAASPPWWKEPGRC